jgi:hypothetical protein
MGWHVPVGYEVLRIPADPGTVLVILSLWKEVLLAAGIGRPDIVIRDGGATEWADGGRVRHPVISAGGRRWLLKAYHRGGLLSHWNHDRYWGRSRFLLELETAVRAIGVGIPAPEPSALIFRGAGGGSFRVWQLMSYMPGVRSLRDILQESWDGSANALVPIFRSAGEAVRRMHEAQIDHPDLNIGNILVRSPSPGAAGSAEAFIVDWDKARLRPRGSWNPYRNLMRLWRSVLKLTAASRADFRADPSLLRSFLRGYFWRNPKGLRELRAYGRSRRAFLAVRMVLWAMGRDRRAP